MSKIKFTQEQCRDMLAEEILDELENSMSYYLHYDRKDSKEDLVNILKDYKIRGI